MLNIKKDGSQIIITCDLKNGWSTDYKRDCGNDFQCDLLHEKLQTVFSKHVSELKKEFYNAGWKEKASKKTRKRDYFSPNISNFKF